jgi:hypothetical protein
MSQVFFALLSSSEPSFEYSITREQLLIYVLHDESTYTQLWFGFIDINSVFLLAGNWLNLYYRNLAERAYLAERLKREDAAQLPVCNNKKLELTRIKKLGLLNYTYLLKF